MNACIIPNQHTSTKINEGMLLINFPRHREATNKKSGAAESHSIATLLWRGKQQSREVQNKWW